MTNSSRHLNISTPTREHVNSEDLYEKAREQFTSGHYKEALPLLAKLASDNRYTAKANSNIASCLMMMGLVRQAKKYIGRALTDNPTFLPALVNLCKALLAECKWEEARLTCKQIVELDPHMEEGWQLYIKSLCALGQHEQALKVVSSWLEQIPESLQGLLHQGDLLIHQDNNYAAIKPLREAIEISPESAIAYRNLSIALHNLHHYEEALTCIDKSLDLEPESIGDLALKGSILYNMGRWKDASKFFGKASSLKPESASLFLNQYLLLPLIPTTTQEIEEARFHFLNGLTLAERDSGILLDMNYNYIAHTFYLAYHNKDDRMLLERYTNLMRKLAEPILSYCQQSHHRKRSEKLLDSTQKIRIGFLSSAFYDHSNTFAFEGLIRHLDRNRFEVILIHGIHSRKDQIRASLDQICDESLQLTSEVSETYNVLHDLNLDILMLTDIGMRPLEWLIPFFRSASIQMTGWGIPHTSGIREIDYYISTHDLEPPNSEESYTETLIKLPGSLPCCFLTEQLKFEPLPREFFFLPPTDILAGCLQQFHKIHPDFDYVLEAISCANPNLVFVFVEDRTASKTTLFLDRLAKNAPTARDKCLVLSRMERHQYHAVCNCMDFLLDPIYYGSGITFFEASLVGTPIVTLEGSNLRSRTVACGYREMGIDDMPITGSIKEYVDLVTELVNDPERLARMKASILNNNHRIYNRMDYVRSFEDFCIKAVNSK